MFGYFYSILYVLLLSTFIKLQFTYFFNIYFFKKSKAGLQAVDSVKRNAVMKAEKNAEMHAVKNVEMQTVTNADREMLAVMNAEM